MATPATKEVLAKRRINQHLGRDSNDGFKLGLAVEGGAMSSIVSAGMMLALRDLNMLDLFDVYIGTSGGGFNLSYILSGQGNNGISIYYDHMTKKEILDLARIAPGGETVMNMSGLEGVIFSEEPFDFDTLITEYGDRLFLTATDVDSLRPAIFKAADITDSYKDLLLAGATIPVISGKAKEVNDIRYVDAFIAYPSPIMAALETGCSHILNLSTQRGTTRENASLIYGGYKKILDREYPGIMDFMDRRIAEYEAALSHKSDQGFTYRQADVLNISLAPDVKLPSRLTQDEWELIEGSRNGYEAVLDLFFRGAKTSMIPILVANGRKFS